MEHTVPSEAAAVSRRTRTTRTTRSTRSTCGRRVVGGLLAAVTVAAVGAGTGGTALAATAATTPPQVQVAGGTWAQLDAAAGSTGTVPVIVSLKPPSSGALTPAARAKGFGTARSGLLARFGGTAKVRGLKAPEGAPFVALHATRAQLAALRSSTEATLVAPDRSVAEPATSSYGSVAGQQLPAQWDYTKIRADWANTNGWTGSGQKIAIIDTGVDRTNPYLSGRVVNEACFSTNTNGTGNCPNGTTAQYSTAAAGIAGASAPCTYNDGCNHGTHVAHTAAGQYGVARGARIVGIKASHPEWDAAKGRWVERFNNSDLISALWYVHTVLPKAGIVVAAVNMSIGGAVSTGYCDDPNNWVTYYINALKSTYQIPTVISSGNNNSIAGVSWPGCNSNAITVGNTTLSGPIGNVDALYGWVSDGSNSSAMVDLLAPGTDICSAVPLATDTNDAKDGWGCGWIGTSMAAPQVAGAIAILTQKRPTATVAQYQAALARAGSTGGVSVRDDRIATGETKTRIDVANAVYYF